MRTVVSVCLAVAATLALAQQQAQRPADSKDKQKDKQAKEEEPSLFGDKRIGLKTTGNAKESTTLAFSGIDPAGKVQNDVLAAPATGADTDKAKKLADNMPKREVLLAFLKEGGLNAK